MRIWRVAKLAELLGVNESEIVEATEQYDDFVAVYRLVGAKKERQVLGTHGVLRKVQNRLLDRAFRSLLTPSDFSHGGIRGRSIKTNVSAHGASRFVYKADVADFYPSITHNRVFHFFRTLGWPEEVARTCTRLCTYQYHLALGLVTSPILADQIFTPIDARIAGACKDADIIYTRYVDDITLSAAYDLDPNLCGVPSLIGRVLNEHGFCAKRDKEVHARIDDPTVPITGVCIRHRHLSATPDFYDRIDNALKVAEELQANKTLECEFFPEQHVRGQIVFAAWLNPGRARPFFRRFRRINWEIATNHAIAAGILAEKPRLVPI